MFLVKSIVDTLSQLFRKASHSIAYYIENTSLGRRLGIKSERTHLRNQLDELLQNNQIPELTRCLLLNIIHHLDEYLYGLGYGHTSIEKLKGILQCSIDADFFTNLESYLRNVILQYNEQQINRCKTRIHYLRKEKICKTTLKLAQYLDHEVEQIEKEHLKEKENFSTNDRTPTITMLSRRLTAALGILKALDVFADQVQGRPKEILESGINLMIEIQRSQPAMTLDTSREITETIFYRTLELIQAADAFDKKNIEALNQQFQEFHEELTQSLQRDQNHQLNIEHASAHLLSIQQQLEAYKNSDKLALNDKAFAIELYHDFEKFRQTGYLMRIRTSDSSLNTFRSKLENYDKQLEKLKTAFQQGMRSTEESKALRKEPLHIHGLADKLIGKIEVLLNQSAEDSSQAALSKHLKELQSLAQQKEPSISDKRLREIERFINGMEQAILPHRISE